MWLFSSWESKNTATARSVCSLQAQSFVFVKNNTHRCVQDRASQTYGCVRSTMLPLSLTPLRLTQLGQRLCKVFSLPLITILFACARIKSRPFHPPQARLSHFKPRSPSSAFLIDLFCFALRRRRCFHSAAGEWRGNKKTCARLFVMHKQEAGWAGCDDGGSDSVSVGGWGGGVEDRGDVPISILHHSAMQIRLWVSVALSHFLKWEELESDWRRVGWILSS